MEVMRRACAIFTLLASGCRFDTFGVEGTDASGPTADGPTDPPADGAVDAAFDAPASPPDAPPPDAAVCVPWTWSPTNFDPCDPLLPPVVTMDFSMPGTYAFDTTDGSYRTPAGDSSVVSTELPQLSGGPVVRVLHLAALAIPDGAVLRVQGTLPLLIVVESDAMIAGDVDVSAFQLIDGTSNPGAGADDAAECGTGAGEPGEAADLNSFDGGGGGGGGGYGADGGDGGDGHGGGKGAKGAKGATWGGPELAPLRAGCGGGNGGDSLESTGLDSGVGGGRGAGGGAVQISARYGLIVETTGDVMALGAGGERGERGPISLTPGRSGGGGGGSGGAILLEADEVSINDNAQVCANGGSGGEGSSGNTSGADGVMGTCSESAEATTPTLSPSGGNGGQGGGLPDSSGDNAINGAMSAGGGGGGGGVGRIRIRGITTLDIQPGSVITPAPVP
jgi:hypothetical protein